VNRKAALHRQISGADDEALTLFAADKLSKLGELAARPPPIPGPAPRPLRSDNRVLAAKALSALVGLLEERQPNHRSYGNSTTSSPRLSPERAMTGGPAEQRLTYPTRPLAHRATQRRNWGATTRKRDGSSATLRPVTVTGVV
jgi:hypothetical protein